MIIRRTSEKTHPFEQKLFRELNLCELQGLLVNSQWSPTIGLECLEFDSDSEFDGFITSEDPARLTRVIESAMTLSDLKGRLFLCQKLSVPFFLVGYVFKPNGNSRFKFYRLARVQHGAGDALTIMDSYEKTEEEFVDWWRTRKGTTQTKPMTNGAQDRTDRTHIDSILNTHGLKWGGNIDAFEIQPDSYTFDNGRITCVIDFLSVEHSNILTAADPRKWYYTENKKYGPRYEGFKVQSKVAAELKVPHIIIYINKNNRHLGLAALTSVAKISPEQISLTKDPKTGREIDPTQMVLDSTGGVIERFRYLLRISKPPVIE